MGEAAGVAEGDAFGVGVGTVAMEINSETVTNLNPFASSSFNVAGTDSIVPG